MGINIKVEINPDGTFKIDVSGIPGQGCYAKMNDLYDKLRAKGLNVKVEKTGVTEEYYQAEQQQKEKESLKEGL